MSICILNKETKSCLPVPIIKKLQSDILDTDYNSSEKIIKELAIKTDCSINNGIQNTELCILNKLNKKVNDKETKLNIKKAIITYFKPITKSYDKNHWLNNSEIDQVQHQLKTLFPGYYYSNIHMIDLVMFNPTHENIIDYNIKCIKDINFIDECKRENNFLTYNGDLKNYGIVCNTDLSSGGGIHWFSIFIDFTSDSSYNIEYFNSSGYDIRNKRFKEYFLNLADEITREVTQCNFIKVTDIQHQREDTANCGSYALFYIWKRLNGTPYSYFAENKIKDEHMEEFRKFLYRLH
jgi:hypothetical protein